MTTRSEQRDPEARRMEQERQEADRIRRSHEHDHDDPITGEPGAHPVGSGIGAAAGGAGGAALGAAAGAAAGGMGGPLGVAAGAIIGGVAGGLVGKGVAEWINPSEEHAFWAEAFQERDYTDDNADYSRYAPAYQFGWEAYAMYGPGNPGLADMAMQNFDDAEHELRQQWESRRREDDLTWDEARPAARDAWHRVHEKRPK